MDLTLPDPPRGSYFFEVQAAFDEYDGKDIWFVRLRRKLWIFTVTVAAHRIDELTQKEVTFAANRCLMDVYASSLASLRDHTRKMLNDEQKRNRS